MSEEVELRCAIRRPWSDVVDIWCEHFRRMETDPGYAAAVKAEAAEEREAGR